MQLLFVLVAASLSSGIYATQSSPIDFAKLHISGLEATASKAQVLTRLGKPLGILEPHYECGEYSSQQVGQKFYQLRYQQATFIGNARHGYELESFKFGPTGPAQLTYGRQPLSSATTLEEFTRLFGKQEPHQNKDGVVEVVVWQQDASAIFTFKAGRLSSYLYNGVGC